MGIDGFPLTRVGLTEVLVHRVALLLINFFRVRSWKLVEYILNYRQNHRSRGLLLAPSSTNFSFFSFSKSVVPPFESRKRSKSKMTERYDRLLDNCTPVHALLVGEPKPNL